MMRFLFLGLSLFLLSFHSFSQAVKGTVVDENGAEIPFAKIRVLQTAYGTVANGKGAFQLELKPGKHILSITAVGFQELIDTVWMENTVLEKKITLSAILQEMNEVLIVVQSKRERGKEVMKQVIDKRPVFQKNISEYQCDTYCFATLEKEKERKDTIPTDSLLLAVENPSITREKLNLVEWRAITSYKNPNKFKDEFYAYNDFSDPSRSMSGGVSIEISSGENLANSEQLDNNPYLIANGIKDIHFSLFDNTIDAPKLTQNPLISPLAFNAFVYYSFFLERTFMDSLGTFINEITVKPRFAYEALFEGTLFIRDSTWELISADLTVNPGVLLFLKDLHIIIDYKSTGIDQLVPIRKEFNYTIREGRKNIYGLARIQHSDYSFVVNDQAKKFWLETTVYTDDAFDKDSSYWNEKRPFTLQEIEKKFIHEQDSIITYHESDEYLRKSDSTRNKIRFVNVIFSGFGHVNSFKKYEFYVNGLISQVIPFGVGGYRHRLQVSYKKEFKNGKYFTVNPDIDYGFLNKDLKGSFGGSFMYNPMNFSKFSLEIGDVYDFITSNQNIQGTFAPANRVRNKKLDVGYSRELINGLYLRSNVLYSDRQSIDSLKYPDWLNVFGMFQTPQPFDAYRILLATVDFEYHFRQKYIIRKNRKVVLGSPWPILNLQYKKGIPNVFGAQSNFDYLEVRVRDEIKLNSFGKAEWKFVAGSFLRKNDLRVIENRFFRPSDRYFFSNPVNTLQLLDTALNTNNSFIQLNFIHHFNGFFLNKVWLLNRLKLEETIGGSFLAIPDANFAQIEFYAGLERRIRIRKSLFKMGIYAVTQENSFSKASVNFKVGFNFYDAFRDRWDY